MRHIARAFLLLLCWAAASAAEQQVFRGRPLQEALRLLQQAGLPIVFSSEVVKPSMRVAAEPRAATPRRQLDELLAPHRLKAEAGPGRVILVVPDRSTATRERPERRRRTTATSGEPSPWSAAHDPWQYSDRVTVWGMTQQPIVSSEGQTALGGNALQLASTVLAADGLDAVHALPGVVAADDFRSEFSVRSSPYRQIGVVIDGVATPWLQHRVYDRSDAGSLSMFASDVVDRVTLQAGAYPRRYDDMLGAQVEVSLKEGSRESTRFNARVGGTSAAVVGEGPIGRDGRGSWIGGVRNSYHSWPPGRLSANHVGFAFADVHAKLVYDLSRSEQVNVTALGGRSTLDTVDEPLVGPLSNGTDRAALVTVGWRSTVGSRYAVRQRISLVGQDLVSTLPAGQLAGRSNNRAVGYQGEALHSVAGGLLEAGAQVFRMSGVRDIEGVGPAAPRDAFRATWWTHAAYVNLRHAAPGGLSFEGGVRASDSTLVHQRGVAPWIRGTWRFTPAWTITAAVGAARQFPELDAILGRFGSSHLVPERATHVDVGVEQRLSRIRWQATLFNRDESHVLRLPDVQPRLVAGVVLDPPSPARYGNSLSDASRGVELVVTPDSRARLSGWLSYTYAMARQTDVLTRETFWSDLDYRHALNASGVLRIDDHTRMGIVLRTASGVPIPGYFDVRNGTLVVGQRRNEVRLPTYVRVDARMQRTFFSSRHAVTVFGEVLNALNRRNQGLAEAVVQPDNGEGVGFSRRLMPRRASVGIEISLGR